MKSFAYNYYISTIKEPVDSAAAEQNRTALFRQYFRKEGEKCHFRPVFWMN